MARITLDITMSLDGFVAGPEPSHGGSARGSAAWSSTSGRSGSRRGARLTAWRAARPAPTPTSWPSTSPRTAPSSWAGACSAAAAGPWEADPNAGGWWGDDPPFHVPVFVVTHHPRESVEMQGGTTFHFVTDGIGVALDRAQEAAGGQDVHVAGGAGARPADARRRPARPADGPRRAGAARLGHPAVREPRREPREARAAAGAGVARRHAPALPGGHVAAAAPATVEPLREHERVAVGVVEGRGAAPSRHLGRLAVEPHAVRLEPRAGRARCRPRRT